MKLTTASAIVVISAAPALAAPAIKARQSNPFGTLVDEPSSFTSAFSTRAVPGTVIANDGSEASGQSNAFGHFGYKINVNEDIICFDIRTVNVTGEYQSPAFTATHIHQGAVGSAGPPRIAFPNPEYVRNDQTGAEIRESKGCLQGPFSTNVTASGSDTGSDSGFSLSEIEANPDGFFTDTHTAQFPAGAVRGQLLRSEVPVERPSYFTSTLRTTADETQVVNAQNASVAGAPGTRAEYVLEINSDEDTLCYDITVYDYPEGDFYFSPAKTATHSHIGGFGITGPPRLAFKNPEPVEGSYRKRSLMERTWDYYTGKKDEHKDEYKKDEHKDEYKKDEHKDEYKKDEHKWYKPEHKDEHKPEPKKDEHKPEYKPEPKKDEHKPEYKPEPKKDEHKPEYKPEPKKDEHKPEYKPEPKKDEHKPEYKPEPKKDEHKPEYKPEPKKDEHKPEYKPEPKKDEHKPEYKPEPKKDEHKPEYKPEPKKDEHKPEYKPEPKKDEHKPEYKPEPKKDEHKPKYKPEEPKKDEPKRGSIRKSSACIKGPFTTGLLNDAGVDTGSASGFTLSDLEANPGNFNADFHTQGFAAGAVRGQLYA